MAQMPQMPQMPMMICLVVSSAALCFHFNGRGRLQLRCTEPVMWLMTSRGRLKSRDPHLAGEKHPTNRMMGPIDEHFFQGGLTT